MGAKASGRGRPTFLSDRRHWARLRFLIPAIVFLLAGCGPKSPDQLVVGMELNYPPFEQVDTQGKPAGISVEMAHALGTFLGRKVRIENIPFDGLIPALKTGKIDVIISSMTETPERAQS